MSIKLTESVVPGATLKYANVSDHSVAELKRWLECRALKQTGRKQELVARVNNCIANGRQNDISLAVDCGKWYDKKQNRITTASSSSSGPTNLPVTTITDVTFKKFPSINVPLYFNKGHIFTYMILNVGHHSDDFEALNEETSTTEKPFRKASQFVRSGYLEDIVDGCDDKYYFLKCKCLASFKDKHYNVSITLHLISGAVLKGTCECIQSTLGKCSHVAALLLYLCEHVSTKGYTADSSSTDRLREWGLGTKRRDPGPINLKEYAIERYQPIRRTFFDPRPSNYTRTCLRNNFLADLQYSQKETMFQALFKIEYDDFGYDEEEVGMFRDLVNLFKLNMDKRMEQIQTSSFEICHEQNNDTWFHYRSYFLTGSVIKQVCNFRTIGAKKNFLRHHLWKMQDFTAEAMEYGKVNEVNAKCAYRSTLQANETLVEFGLVVKKKYPFLAASVDGAVVCDDHIVKLVEYKCPKVLEKCHPKDYLNNLTRVQLLNFCLDTVDGEIILKKNHTYAYQIALYMFIFSTEHCDLFIWSPIGYIILNIKAKDYIHCIISNISKLQKFYYQCFVPEMFMMRTPRQLNPVELE